jgi:2,3-dihydroxybiphenyl 1,2-dioxygenase
MNLQAIRSLGYLELGVASLERWQSFALDILGMQVGVRHADGSVGMRIDDHEQRLVLRESTQDELLTYGWEVGSEGDLAALVAHLRAGGHEVTEGSLAERRARGVFRLFACADPVHRFRHEFYCGPRVLGPTHPFQSPIARGGFRAGTLGLGHVALTTPDYPKSVDFYKRALGLGVSGYADVAMPGGVRFEGTFLFGWAGRHHSLAVLPGTQPRPTRHLMVEYLQLDDVGLAYERCKAAGIPIERDFGVHEGDGMFSFYALTPSGYLMEIGWGGLTGTDWGPATLLGLSRWGHGKP